jgi:hypothetical protein
MSQKAFEAADAGLCQALVRRPHQIFSRWSNLLRGTSRGKKNLTQTSKFQTQSGLVRWLLDDMPEQRKRIDQLLVSGQKFEVEDVALVELVFMLGSHYKLFRVAVVAALRQVLALAVLRLDRSLWSEVLDLYLAHPKLSAVDIYLSA